MRRVYYIFQSIAIIFILTSCGRFGKIQRSPDWKLKYDAAIEYYKRGETKRKDNKKRAHREYYKSSTLLVDLLPIIRGTKEAEFGNFALAYCYFHQNSFVLSAHHFSEFVRTFGRSEYRQEAEYLHALSMYNQSPEYNLDQSPTYKAVDVLQSYIENYPLAENTKTIDSLISELQVKLETKAYNNAKLYHKIQRYKAALVVFKNFHKDYPDSHYRQEIYFFGIETMYDFARASIPSKQKERYQECISMYEKFIDTYPNSSLLKDAEQFFIKSSQELAKFANQNNLE